MGVTLTSPRPAHGALNWDTAMEADLAALASSINVPANFTSTNVNLNLLTQSGIYQGNAGTDALVNAPDGVSTFFVWVIRRDVNTSAQMALNVSSGGLWQRTQTGSTWTAWRRVVDSSSDTGWVTASTGITAATGWTLNNSQYRNQNGVVATYLNLTRTGAALTASAAGIVTPTNAVVLPAGLIPARSNGVISAVGTASTVAASCYANSNGNIVLSNIAPSQSVTVNGVLELMGTFLL